MNVKELIAKIRFSHIICLSVGALIPIYSDVLFFHGFDSSTVSAIMDTLLVGFAAYAAYQVKDWLNDKVKNKGFEQAEKLLMNLHQSFIMTFYLKNKYDDFCNEYVQCKELPEEQKDKMHIKSRELLEHSNTLNLKLAELLAEISTLKSWDMHCTAVKAYSDYVSQCEKARENIDSFIISAVKTPYYNRHFIWKRKNQEIEKQYEYASELYKQLEIRFESVFYYRRKKSGSDGNQ